MFIKHNSMKNIINVGIEAYGIITAPLDPNMGGKSLKNGKSAGKPAPQTKSSIRMAAEPAPGQLLADRF
ncbi:MAG: hypothetical protein RKP73_06260, partial [Candidatus Contendobacter sp.]|nr:hypothetical protein [Candidatus Contendobacter sp.]